jgi:hypothetical protein
MNVLDLFHSPMAAPFRRHRYNGMMAILVTFRTSRITPVSRCVYTASSMRDLKRKMRELHRVQSSMGLPIGIAPQETDMTKAFLCYALLDEPFVIRDGNVIIASSATLCTSKPLGGYPIEKKIMNFEED